MNNPIYSSKFKSVAFAIMTPLLSAAILISAQPAQAQSFLFASNNNGLNGAQAASINNLNTSRAQANAAISAAVANGTLSVDQASLYQNQLNANANEQNNYVNSGNFNFAQMQSVLTNFQNINTSITSSIAAGATNNFNTNNGNSNGWNNGRRKRGNGRWNNGYNQVNTSYWSGVDSQLSAALTRIQDGLNNHSLSQFEYNDLKRQYDLIVSREAQYKTSGGRFSNSERTALERQIDALNNSITREVTDRERANNRHGRWR